MKHRIALATACLITFASAGIPCAAASASSARRELQQVVRKEPNMTRGADLFGNCAVCHGTNGSGAPDGSVPSIAGQHFRVIAKQLVDYRHHRRWDIRMERLADKHLLTNPQDIADVAGYASSLSHKHPSDKGAGEFREHGRELFARQCEVCHDESAGGEDAHYTPRLAGQHYEYLLRQMYDTVEGRRPNMTDDHIRLLKPFVMEDYEGLADYLSSLDGSKVIDDGG
jgi:cytochrome c553